jgi:hypothetical protein
MQTVYQDPLGPGSGIASTRAEMSPIVSSANLSTKMQSICWLDNEARSSGSKIETEEIWTPVEMLKLL